MRAFQRREPGISPDKILEMVTVNAARVLVQENALGRLRPGFQADLISIPIGANPNLFEEIVAFDRPIDWMMVNGMQMTKSE
jgi:imidazolonepropionase-like amidohydrolase